MWQAMVLQLHQDQPRHVSLSLDLSSVHLESPAAAAAQAAASAAAHAASAAGGGGGSGVYVGTCAEGSATCGGRRQSDVSRLAASASSASSSRPGAVYLATAMIQGQAWARPAGVRSLQLHNVRMRVDLEIDAGSTHLCVRGFTLHSEGRMTLTYDPLTPRPNPTSSATATVLVKVDPPHRPARHPAPRASCQRMRAV